MTAAANSVSLQVHLLQASSMNMHMQRHLRAATHALHLGSAAHLGTASTGKPSSTGRRFRCPTATSGRKW
jgi:hypothetical protein